MFIFAFLLFGCAGTVWGENLCLIPTDKHDDPVWEEKHENLVTLVEENTSKEIVWIGDSIIEIMQWSTLWYNFVEPFGSINLGIGGDRVENILWRIESDEFDFKTNIKAVVIFVGTNNIYDTSPEDIAEGVINLVEVTKNRLGRNMIVLLPTLLPRGEDPNDIARPLLVQVNDLLKAKYPRNPTDNVYIVEIGQDAIGPDGMLSTDDFSDYLHPTDIGYTKFFTPVYDQLVSIFGQK